MHAGLAQALQDEQPPGKVGIEYDVLAAHLDEKTGIRDKSDVLSGHCDQLRLWVRPVRGVTPSAVPGC